MVTITKRIIKGSAYYYIEHTVRIHGVPQKKELYLGREIPKDIEKLKKEFFHDVFKNQYFAKLDKIKERFSLEYQAMPISAREKYLNYFLVKFTYDTNRIEGSTLSYKDTAKILDEGVTPKEKPLEDVREAQSHKKVFLDMLGYTKELSLGQVLFWHTLLLQDTKPDIAGKIRNHPAKVSGSKAEFPLPVELNGSLGEFFESYRRNKKLLHPVELAAVVHLKLVSIHPFSDGNGRISRLLMNFVLNKHSYPMLNIKYKNRSMYYTALERSQLSGNKMVFVQHIIKRYIKEYKKFL